MKRTLLILLLLLCGTISYSQVSVKGYYKSNGTYVQPHERTPPNSTITDNYSYPGNYNPNTGKVTGSSTYTYSKKDDYGIGSGAVDWGAIGRNDLKDFDREQTYIPAKTKISYTSSKNLVPKYIPLSKRKYLVNPRGEKYGYSFSPEINTIMKPVFIYDMKGIMLFWLNISPSGDMYVYDTEDNFVKLIPSTK